MEQKKRLINTGLRGATQKDILASVLGQLSDGWWENSPRMDPYWKHAKIVEENGKVIGAFEVNTGHKNGNEIHVVYNNGIVKIYNKTSQKYITAIIARIPQMERYGIECTKTMKKKINKHVKENLNYL